MMNKMKMGRAMPMRGNMADKAGRAMPGFKKGGEMKGVKKMAMGGLGGMGGLREGDTSYQLTGGRRGTDSQLSGANRLARPKQATGVMVPGGKLSGLRAGMKKGGSVGGSYRKAADGVAHKGKTKGKMVKMNYGGKC